MTEAMPFLQKYDITFLRPPTIGAEVFLRLSGNLIWFPDRRLAGCCAQTLCAGGVQSPHLQPEMYFLSRTCRERK